MREPVFDETLQLGIVVRDLEATMRRYVDDYGIGPWVYARFLAEKGEGVHHVAVATPNFDQTVAQATRENDVILSGEFGGARVAYLGMDRDLGVVIEIFSGTAAGGRPDESGP